MHGTTFPDRGSMDRTSTWIIEGPEQVQIYVIPYGVALKECTSSANDSGPCVRCRTCISLG